MDAMVEVNPILESPDEDFEVSVIKINTVIHIPLKQIKDGHSQPLGVYRPSASTSAVKPRVGNVMCLKGRDFLNARAAKLPLLLFSI